MVAPGRERHHVNGQNGGVSSDLHKRDLLRAGVACVGCGFQLGDTAAIVCQGCSDAVLRPIDVLGKERLMRFSR